MFKYVTGTTPISSTAKATTQAGPIGTRVREIMEAIPPQQGLALNDIAKVLMDEFGIKDLHSAYLRIQTHFKGKQCMRKWGAHLVKMQDTKTGYVVIFNNKLVETNRVEGEDLKDVGKDDKVEG